jgi:hypothetical protein
MTANLDLLVETDGPRTGTLGMLDQLLRDSSGVLLRIRAGLDLAGLARAAILAIVAGAAVFGAALGAHRGGVQILFAAVKLPLVILLTAAVCAPALTALNSAFGRPACIRRDLALVLVALARGTTVIVAETPLVLLAVRFGASYHEIVLLAFGCCAAGGLTGLVLLWRGLEVPGLRFGWGVCVTLLAVFTLVGAQMAWSGRPYVVRPRIQSVQFLRSVDSNILESVLTSFDSARGVYHRSEAPVPEWLVRQ